MVFVFECEEIRRLKYSYVLSSFGILYIQRQRFGTAFPFLHDYLFSQWSSLSFTAFKVFQIASPNGFGENRKPTVDLPSCLQ